IAPRWGYHLNPEPNPTRYGKDAPWKSPKAGFSTALGNPAKCAGFPLFHSDHDCYMSKPKNQNRTFHLLRKADILTCYEHLTAIAFLCDCSMHPSLDLQGHGTLGEDDAIWKRNTD